jgi:hypothetical protein
LEKKVSMIKQALEYLVSLKNNQLVEIDGKHYSTEKLNYIPPVLDQTPTVSPISISTLTGLVDYIKGKVDFLDKTLVVHIVSPTQVNVYSELKKDATRDSFISCKAWTPQITYERFLDVENFNIMIQSCFLQNEHSAAILKVVGNIVEENVNTIKDDGVSQSVIGKAGIAKIAEIPVPNPVVLCPFRTFAEVEQPESKFIFRMQSGPKAAIFEADGGIWRIYAMQNVKAYLTEKLQNCNVKIIS